MPRSTDGQIRIAYGAVPAQAGGFLPVYWENGRRRGDAYRREGWDRDVACAMARRDALEEKSRYVGDWDLRFVDRCARGNTGRTRR